ncbi:MAG: hypothetical protein KatS3mg008_0442 [Acidimicrobiales bacterium]|nr:MAG: hypothetical protein KatS3mg008_0442 [Acidimicrobiales bacterium]
MRVRDSLLVRCEPRALFALIEDLSRYPAWTDLVADVGPDPEREDAWFVELSATIGPIRRSKRLRMVRTVHRPPHEVRFEREELDGRRHSAWTLSAEVVPTSDGCRLNVELYYGGMMPSPVLTRILAASISRAKPRLAALAEGR